MRNGASEGDEGDEPSTLSPEQCERFFSMIAVGSSVMQAAEAIGVTSDLLYRIRRRDPQFRQEWDEASKFVYDVLRVEVLRRVRDGVAKPVYHAGERVDTYQHYSDALALFVLRNKEAVQTAAADDPDEGLEPHEIAERARRALEERMEMLSQRVRVGSGEGE